MSLWLLKGFWSNLKRVISLQVWRVGIMGFNAQPRNIELLLAALKDALTHVGFSKAEKVL
jgi:aspartate aminotransferase-like enzyme